ncbi:hypothetical protein LWI29_014033 [Acer saccharum]|uniref:non-specific serine/threonine protein kinase n=1 Tax=Acer saccharum TaxID=4024 RepID=A0AA39SSE2_ACESA|nr:hypothetical protein LWI29_014033 [Acer saccharum]
MMIKMGSSSPPLQVLVMIFAFIYWVCIFGFVHVAQAQNNNQSQATTDPNEDYNFSIKAGGPQITSSNGIVYERDNATLGPASYFVTDTRRWGVSNVGSFAENNNPRYISSSSSQFTNTLDSELFQTARISASSLRYYGLGLENGDYNVTLQFAEMTILDTTSWQSVGRRVFDIYIQGNRVRKDFNIKNEAGGVSKSAVQMQFTAQVSENYLEIHLFWAGKGTCCIPTQRTYGPSISAISATPNFIPSVSNIPPTSPKKNRTGLIAGIVVGVGLLSLLSIIAILWIVRRRNKPRDDDEVQHRNLVKLYGCCIEGSERLLVYEYLENKSLDQALFGETSLNFNWSTRYDICLGVAREYAMRGHLTEKTDVFAFGVVALEIVSGRPNSDSSLDEEQMYLLEWAWNLHENNRQVELVDSRLPEFNEEVKRMIGVALLCTQTMPSLRPPMSHVVAMLYGDMEVSPVTTKPGYLTDWKYDDTSTASSFMSSDKATIGTEYNSNFTSSSTTVVADAQHSPANVTKPILHDIIGDDYNFSIKCGGPQITSSNGIVYERDNTTLGPSSYFVTNTRRWGVSNVGYFTGSNNPQYTTFSKSQFTNTLDSELFQTARTSASSLRYYGLGLENGNYNVTLQFTEMDILDTTSWESIGRRKFDIYIQGNRVLKDFEIKKEAGGISERAVQKQFKAQVSENYLEIHLFWAGKGTCCIPNQGTYGPSISAISATPDFIPTISNNPPTSRSKTNRTGLIVGIVVGVGLISFLLAAILWIIRRRKRPSKDDDDVLQGIDVKPYTFSYAVLKTATEDFSPENKLGEGGFGPVYKGKLDDGRAIAVKQLSVASQQGKSQFVAEIVAISAVQHRNLVKLGYLAPEYAMRGHLTEKTDVFAFGVVALEVVSGRPNSDSSLDEEQVYLLEWAWHLHENNQEAELVDSRLPEFNEEEVKRLIAVALLCTQTLPSLRPPMSRVVAMLCGDMEVSTVTTKPGYLTDWKYDDTTTTGSFVSSTDKATIGIDTSSYTSSTTTSMVVVAETHHSAETDTEPILYDNL